MSASSNSACTTIVAEPLHPLDWSYADDGQPTTYARVQAQVQHLLRMTPHPCIAIKSVPESLQALVMDILQQELDGASPTDPYYSACLRCLRVLIKDRGILPSSLICQAAVKEGTYPVCGGGFADIWKGRLHGNQVCLKVLRVFMTEQNREKLKQDLCQEAFVWKLLRHPNVLPFLGVNADLFSPSFCLISPWMANGTIISYLKAHPDYDRYISLVQISQGMQYLHSLDPQIVHADIRGANILVTVDRRCCLADFGLSLIVESEMLDSTSRMRKGAIRWLAPEYIDFRLLDKSCLAARDIYAFGCTIIEIFTGNTPYSTDGAVMYKVFKGNRPPRPPLDVFPDDSLWSLVKLCLATLPKKRPSADLIVSRLEKRRKEPFTLSRLVIQFPVLTGRRVVPMSIRANLCQLTEIARCYRVIIQEVKLTETLGEESFGLVQTYLIQARRSLEAARTDWEVCEAFKQATNTIVEASKILQLDGLLGDIEVRMNNAKIKDGHAQDQQSLRLQKHLKRLANASADKSPHINLVIRVRTPDVDDESKQKIIEIRGRGAYTLDTVLFLTNLNQISQNLSNPHLYDRTFPGAIRDIVARRNYRLEPLPFNHVLSKIPRLTETLVLYCIHDHESGNYILLQSQSLRTFTNIWETTPNTFVLKDVFGLIECAEMVSVAGSAEVRITKRQMPSGFVIEEKLGVWPELLGEVHKSFRTDTNICWAISSFILDG